MVRNRDRNLQALLSRGTELARIVNAPFTRPAPPIPATARPTINISELVEMPHIKEPSSKRKRNAKKTI